MALVDYRTFVRRDLPLVERGCTSKAVYLSRADARAYASHGRRSDGSLRPYHCAHCSLWHLGHRRRRHRLPAELRRPAG